MSGSLIGFCCAVCALWGVGINLALRESYLNSGTETSAYWTFLASYVVAAILTWMLYVRPQVSARASRERSLKPSPRECDDRRNRGNASAIAR
jgi:NNP family nitrate/nitrite transporter-like MFS transporter